MDPGAHLDRYSPKGRPAHGVVAAWAGDSPPSREVIYEPSRYPKMTLAGAPVRASACLDCGHVELSADYRLMVRGVILGVDPRKVDKPKKGWFG